MDALGVHALFHGAPVVHDLQAVTCPLLPQMPREHTQAPRHSLHDIGMASQQLLDSSSADAVGTWQHSAMADAGAGSLAPVASLSPSCVWPSLAGYLMENPPLAG
ncbi:MAG TPA: hypothetical protein VI542_07200 [Candidatus Tectomicrobia bacterium]